MLLKHLLFFSALLLLLLSSCKTEQPHQEPAYSESSLADTSADKDQVVSWLQERSPVFKKIAVGDNLYGTAVLSPEELRVAFTNLGIKTRIRMYGNGRDCEYKRDGKKCQLTIEQEQAICNELGVKLVILNAHEKGTSNQFYQGTAEKLVPILEEGNVLFGCKHFRDRGRMAEGVWLRYNGYDKTETIAELGWSNYPKVKISKDKPGNHWGYGAYYRTGLYDWQKEFSR